MIFDLLVVIAVLGGIALGAWKGLAWQIAAIISLVAGFAVGIPLSKPLAPLFGSTAPFNRFVALAVIYVAVSLGVYLLALFYRKTIEKWELHRWDHHLGGVFGAIKGYLFCVMLAFFAITLVSALQKPILTTRMGWLMGRTMDLLHPVWPPEVHDILHPYIHHLDEPSPTPVPTASPIPTPTPAASPGASPTPTPEPHEHHHD